MAELDSSMVSLDVTASLQAWANGETNNGWVIAQNALGSANNWYFYSAEGSTPPLLEVTFAAVPEPSVLTLLGLGSLGLWILRRRTL